MTFRTCNQPLNIGPLGGCTFCAYELERQGDHGAGCLKGPLEPATTTIETKNGPRDVCDAHARAGKWKGAP